MQSGKLGGEKVCIVWDVRAWLMYAAAGTEHYLADYGNIDLQARWTAASLNSRKCFGSNTALFHSIEAPATFDIKHHFVTTTNRAVSVHAFQYESKLHPFLSQSTVKPQGPQEQRSHNIPADPWAI